jgi:flagellin
MTALTAEIDRIANVTSWAGEELLDGATPSSATTDADSASFTFHVGARNNAADSITATIAATGSTALGIAGTGNFAEAMTNVTTVAATAAKMTVTQGSGTIAISGAADAETYSVKINGTTVNITTAFAGDQYEDSDIGVAQQLADEIEAAGIAGVVVTGQGTDTLTVKIGQSLDISSATNAQAAIGTIDSALRIVNNNRADLGAVSNRLDSTIANLSNIAINLEDGRSRIEDADFAAESASLAKQQIMLQAGTAMLAQANASQQNVLSLLG